MSRNFVIALYILSVSSVGLASEPDDHRYRVCEIFLSRISPLTVREGDFVVVHYDFDHESDIVRREEQRALEQQGVANNPEAEMARDFAMTMPSTLISITSPNLLEIGFDIEDNGTANLGRVQRARALRAGDGLMGIRMTSPSGQVLSEDAQIVTVLPRASAAHSNLRSIFSPDAEVDPSVMKVSVHRVYSAQVTEGSRVGPVILKVGEFLELSTLARSLRPGETFAGGPVLCHSPECLGKLERWGERRYELVDHEGFRNSPAWIDDFSWDGPGRRRESFGELYISRFRATRPGKNEVSLRYVKGLETTLSIVLPVEIIE